MKGKISGANIEQNQHRLKAGQNLCFRPKGQSLIRFPIVEYENVNLGQKMEIVCGFTAGALVVVVV